MKNERYEKIMNILAERGYASVDRLSKELFVSMPTVRRDLNTMQDLGLVVRSHGGVMPRLSDMDGGPAVFRMGVNPQEKLKLDKAAAKLLRDNCMVFMDESTTTLHIIDQMSAYKNITVVTNNISVLQLAAKYRVPTICLGGETCYDTMSFYGYEAEELITHFGIDIMFYSSSAITPGGVDRRLQRAGKRPAPPRFTAGGHEGVPLRQVEVSEVWRVYADAVVRGGSHHHECQTAG